MPDNIAQRMTDATLEYAATSSRRDGGLALSKLLGEMAAAISELDATKADAVAITEVSRE